MALPGAVGYASYMLCPFMDFLWIQPDVNVLPQNYFNNFNPYPQTLTPPANTSILPYTHNIYFPITN